jgi:hypothetical protein
MQSQSSEGWRAVVMPARDLAKEVDDGLNAVAVALDAAITRFRRDMAGLREQVACIPGLEAEVTRLQAEVERLRCLVEHPDGG